MSVTAKNLPSAVRLVGVIDREAQAAMKRAQQHVAPIVASETPRGRTGRLAAAMRPRVSRTTTGARMIVQAPRGRRGASQATVAQVARWVTRGTGLYRTTGTDVQPARRIRSTRRLGRMTLPGGRKVWSVKGQRPNPFLNRVLQRSAPQVEQILQRAAADAARAAEREIA